MSEAIQIAVIGGTGLYAMSDVEQIETRTVDTPFGSPSGEIVIGELRGKRVAFLPRHGAGHLLSPAALPQRANMYALKTLGVRYIFAVNACGSLREHMEPGHLVVPDQIVEYTIGTRARSYFDEGEIVAHIAVPDPFDAYLRQTILAAAENVEVTVHDGATFLIEDGPRFATRAESHLFRAWGCDIIGMTTAPEAFLAREAEMAYASLAHVTDYDSWHETEEAVSVEVVVRRLGENVQRAQEILANAIEALDPSTESPAHTALDTAIASDLSLVSAEALDTLRPILARVLKKRGQ